MLAWLLNWLGCLLVTVVVWPWRAMTGRWPVVAYPVGNGGPDDGFHRAYAQGRAAANALVEQWAEQIRQTGHPMAKPAGTSGVAVAP